MFTVIAKADHIILRDEATGHTEHLNPCMYPNDGEWKLSSSDTRYQIKRFETFDKAYKVAMRRMTKVEAVKPSKYRMEH